MADAIFPSFFGSTSEQIMTLWITASREWGSEKGIPSCSCLRSTFQILFSHLRIFLFSAVDIWNIYYLQGSLTSNERGMTLLCVHKQTRMWKQMFNSDTKNHCRGCVITFLNYRIMSLYLQIKISRFFFPGAWWVPSNLQFQVFYQLKKISFYCIFRALWFTCPDFSSGASISVLHFNCLSSIFIISSLIIFISLSFLLAFGQISDIGSSQNWFSFRYC